jgi:hypothetical protein
MEMALDQVWIYKFMQVRICDFKTVNNKPGAVVIWEPIDPKDEWYREPPMEVELTQLRELKLIKIA